MNGKTTYITICKNIILSNLKNHTNKPPIRISKGKYGKPRHAYNFSAQGNIKVVCNMNNPLPWGARVWLEIENETTSGA